MTLRLAREDGIFAGISTGANVVGAHRLAERLGPDAVIVTLAVDSGLQVPERRAVLRARLTATAQSVAVLSDVHGNAVALEAVLGSSPSTRRSWSSLAAT